MITKMVINSISNGLTDGVFNFFFRNMQLRRVHLGTGIIIWHCQNLDFQVSNDKTTVLYNFNCSVENGSHTITRSQNTH